jgi:hypothetical protein
LPIITSNDAEPIGRLRVDDSGTTIGKQLPQDRPVASMLVFAVTSDGKVRHMGKRSQKIENLSSVMFIHLGSKLPLEVRPRFLILNRPAFFHELQAGRKIGQPDIVKILLAVFGPFHRVAGTVAASAVGCMLRSAAIRSETPRSNQPGCQLKGEEK